MKAWTKKRWTVTTLLAASLAVLAFVVLQWHVYQRLVFYYGHPTSVQIVRPQQGHIKSLNVTVTNEQEVRQMATTLREMQPSPRGPSSCAADFGIEYTLTFKSGNRTLFTAQADPNGCELIRLSTGQVLWGGSRPGSPLFWSTLAQSLGMPSAKYLIALGALNSLTTGP